DVEGTSVTASVAEERGDVEPRTETFALTRQHHRTARGVSGHLVAGLHDCLEHGRVQSVQLVGSGQPDVGHAAFDFDGHTIGHWCSWHRGFDEMAQVWRTGQRPPTCAPTCG